MRYFIFLLALVLTACGSYSANVPSIKPYKMDIQQGNVITPKMMMQLRPGMSKSQVRFIMGTPLLVDSFHGDRWDYFYQMRKEGKIIEERRVILEFDGEALKHVRGDVIPAGSDANVDKAPSGLTQPHSVPAKAPVKEKGLLDKLKFWGDEEPASKTTGSPSEQPQNPEKQLPIEKPLVAPIEEPKKPVAEPIAPKATPQPVEQKAEQPKPNEEKEKGWLDRLKFWGSEEESAKPGVKPAVEEAPAVKAKEVVKEKEAPKPVDQEPVVKPKPKVIEPAQEVSRPVVEQKVVPVKNNLEVKKDVEAKRPPKPSNDLPPEDDPGYFEKMLEKIGF